MTQVVIPPGTETEPSARIRLPGGGRGIVATEGPDSLPGSSGSDNISSGEGDDLVAAGAGDDNVLLGNGNDTATGGSGRDSLQGNQGDDSVDGGLGDDSLHGGKGNDRVEGGDGDDILFGDRGDDIVSGGTGNDNVQGNLGLDCLDGGEGNDSLDGGKGNDSLDGGIGDDFLSGSRGNDVLTGGAGADDFFFWFNADGSYGVDTLTDFNRTEGDRIVLAANFPVPEDSRFAALTGTPSGAPVPAEEFQVIENFNPEGSAGETVVIIYDPASGLIYYNPTPAVGDENQFAQVDSTVFDSDNPLQNTDFEIF